MRSSQPAPRKTALKQIPLHSLHAGLGAKFGPFAGYDMPLFYPAGVLKEHLHTRAHAGLFDISHMLHVDISGRQAADLVSRLCPYPAREQKIGQGRYTFFLNDNAGIVDDLIVTRLADDRFRIVCNAGCADKDVAHMRAQQGGFGAKVTPLERAFLALQGPEAESVLADEGLGVEALGFMQAAIAPNGWFVSRSGYTGEDGFEIALPAGEAEAFARKLLADSRVLPIGLGARDSLRLEAALPLYGQELSDDITPMEAGMSWAIPKELRAGGEFVGSKALAARFAEGPRRKRVGLRPEGAAPVRAHAPVFDATGARVGEITSGGFGPTVNGPVALGLVSTDAQPPFEAELRGRRVALALVTLPFVLHRYKR